MSQQPPHGEQPADQSSWGQRPLPSSGQPPQNWSAVPHPLPPQNYNPQTQQPFQYATGYGPVQTRASGGIKQRKKRTLLFSLAIVSFLLLLSVLAVIFYNQTQTQASRTIVPPLPTPGAARTTYSNTSFRYIISYPTQWHLQSQANQTLVRIFMKYDLSVPQAIALELRCYANANQLDARTFWQQSHLSHSGEIGRAMTTLSSGVPAYVVTGEGQTPFTLYVVTHGLHACTILAPETDPANAQVVTATINTFRWQ